MTCYTRHRQNYLIADLHFVYHLDCFSSCLLRNKFNCNWLAICYVADRDCRLSKANNIYARRESYCQI